MPGLAGSSQETTAQMQCECLSKISTLKLPQQVSEARTLVGIRAEKMVGSEGHCTDDPDC